MENNSVKLKNFSNALARLKDALAVPDSNPLKIDGSIQRFEFTYEACKKFLIAELENRDIFVRKNFREAIKKAGQQKLITSMELWDKMRADRNDTAHEYDEKESAEIYSRIPEYVEEFEFILETIKEQNKD